MSDLFEIALGIVWFFLILTAAWCLISGVTAALWTRRHRERPEPVPDEIVVEWLYVMPDEASYPEKDEVAT